MYNCDHPHWNQELRIGLHVCDHVLLICRILITFDYLTSTVYDSLFYNSIYLIATLLRKLNWLSY